MAVVVPGAMRSATPYRARRRLLPDRFICLAELGRAVSMASLQYRIVMSYVVMPGRFMTAEHGRVGRRADAMELPYGVGAG